MWSRQPWRIWRRFQAQNRIHPWIVDFIFPVPRTKAGRSIAVCAPQLASHIESYYSIRGNHLGLRPANLIRPPSSPYTAELPAKRKRPSGIQVKVKDIKYHLDVQRRFHHSSASSSQASSSRDLPSVAGSSRIFLQREAQRAVLDGHPRTATQVRPIRSY